MTAPPTPPARRGSSLPRQLLIARGVLATAIVALDALLITANPSTTAPGHTSVDRIVDGIATTLLVAVATLLLVAQVIAVFHAVTVIRAVDDPAAALLQLGTRPRRPAVLAALAICGVIVLSAVLPPADTPAAPVELLGLGLVSLVLDTVGANRTYQLVARSLPASSPSPSATRRIHGELAQSATISRVFGSLLLLAVVVTVIEQFVTGPPRAATAAPQIGAAVSAALVAFVLAVVLSGVSRSGGGGGVEVTALHRAATRLWLTIGAAVLTSIVAYLVVLGTDYTADKLPTYQALASVFVLLVAVLNSTSLSQLQGGTTPDSATSRPSPRRR